MRLATLTQQLARMLFLAWLLLSSTLLFSQQRKVSGKITNSTGGQPIPGATVNIKGSNLAVVSDAEGVFSITVPNDNAVLLISSVGFDNLEIPVNGRTTVNAELKEKTSSLDEIVVTGYTTQRKKDLTGSVAVVEMNDVRKQPDAQINNQLQGQVSGVTVVGSGSPGEQPQVRIRGFNTFGNNTPLYVVDGVPTQNIFDINANDVATMQVLKDAGAASIYGSRANNGVIIITTKRGSGKVKVQYDAYYGTQVPKKGNVWNTLTPQERADLWWLAKKNSGEALTDALYGSGATPVLPDYISPAGLSEGDPDVDPSKYNVNPDYTSTDEYNNFYRITKANKAGTDWFHEIFSPAPITNHNIAVSGGSNQGSYLFSFNYFDQKGTLMNTYLKRYTLRANSLYKVRDGIRIGENFAISMVDNPRSGILNEGTAIGMAMRQLSIIPVHDIMGNYGGTYSTNGAKMGEAVNPVAQQYRTRNNKGLGTRIFGNVFAEVDLFKQFTLRSSFGGEIYSGYSHSFGYPTYENAENGNTNSYSEGSYFGYNWTWTNTLNYQQTFGDHDLKVLIGTEAYDNKGRNVGGSTQDYFSFDPDYVNLSSGSGTVSNYSGSYSDGLVSYFGRVDYSYKQKYIIGATVRRDGSSRFLTYQWGTFPAVSAGWRISEENFLKGIAWLTDLKIRGSYGVMGNQLNVDPNNAFTTFDSDKSSSYYPLDGSGLALGFRQQRIGNPDAKWEKDINANFGIDATLFGGKIDITADYYRKDIRDLLFQPTLPGTIGSATPPVVNIAQIKSSGFDGSIGGHFDLTNDLRLDANLTFTTYNSKIMKVSDGADYFDDGNTAKRFNGSYIVRNIVGHGISTYFGYQIVGFWNSQAEIDAANADAQKAANNPDAVYQTDVKVGRFRYADVNQDGLVTPDDRTVIGNPNPKFSYGLNLALTYKNFDFSMFLYGVQGNDLWNNIKWWRDFSSSFNGAKSYTALYESWTPDRQNAKVAIQETGASFSTANVPNSYFVEKGSYLRAKNILIGYTFKQPGLTSLGISNLRVYVQAANLFTITKYSGIDPEITGSTTAFGIDEGAYPNQKQYLIGINLSF